MPLTRPPARLLALALVLLARPAGAQVPDRYALEGRLTNGLEPVTSQVSVTSTVYTSATGGSAPATETGNVTPDEQGRFSRRLGDDSALEAADLAGRPHLEVEIDAQPLSPRLPILPAPQALYAAEAEAPAPNQRIVLAPREDAAANGQALLAALQGITDSSSLKPYRVELAPGTYDLGSETAFLPNHVGLFGAGQDITTITGTGFAVVEVFSGTSEAQLQDLTLATSTTSAVALSTGSISGTLYLERVTLEATGSAWCYSPNGGTLVGRFCRFTSEATVAIVDGPYSLELQHSEVTSTTSSAIDVLRSGSGGSLLLNGCKVDSGVGFAFSASGAGSSARAYNSELTGEGIAVVAGNASDIEVLGSSIRQTGASPFAISQVNGGTVKLSQTLIEGGFNTTGSPTFLCFGNYDESYAAKSCP